MYLNKKLTHLHYTARVQFVLGLTIYLMSTQLLSYIPIIIASVMYLFFSGKKVVEVNLIVFFLLTNIYVILSSLYGDMSVMNSKPLIFGSYVLASFVIATIVDKTAIKTFGYLVLVECAVSALMYVNGIYSFFVDYPGVTSPFVGEWYHSKTAGLSLHSSQLALKAFIVVLLLNDSMSRKTSTSIFLTFVFILTKSRTLLLFSLVKLTFDKRIYLFTILTITVVSYIFFRDLLTPYINIFLRNYSEVFIDNGVAPTAGRLYLLHHGLFSFQEQNIFFGNFGAPYRVSFGEQEIKLHNEILQIYAEMGIFGLIIYSLLTKYFFNSLGIYILMWALTAPILLNIGSYIFIIVFYLHINKLKKPVCKKRWEKLPLSS